MNNHRYKRLNSKFTKIAIQQIKARERTRHYRPISYLDIVQHIWAELLAQDGWQDNTGSWLDMFATHRAINYITKELTYQQRNQLNH